MQRLIEHGLVDYVRSRLFYRSLDAAMTASLRPRRGLKANLRTLVSLRSSNYDRVASLVNAVDRVVPGTARWVTNRIYRPFRPPFPAKHVELLAFGSGSTAFRAHTETGDKVIKFYRKSLGVSARRLPAVVRVFREKYEVVSEWYKETPGLVWPAEFVLLDGPIFGRPALACVQEYIAGEMRDFFQDFSEDELAVMLSDSEGLREEFLAFARQTMTVYESQRMCADFVGHNNLTVVTGGDRPRLHLIDYGLFDFDESTRRVRRASRQLEHYLARIGSLANRFLPGSDHVASPDVA